MSSELPAEDRAVVESIEAERRRLLACHDPLAPDGAEPVGPFDRGHTVAEACAVSESPRATLLLYLLTRELDPRHVVELGTNVGISSAYIAAALLRNGRGGRLVTLDASPQRQALARDLHSRLGFPNVSYVLGYFADTLAPALASGPPVDLAFVDGHHQYQPTLDYCDQILGSSSPHAVLVFDDIRWSDGMKRAWKGLRADSRFGLCLDLSTVGVCARAEPGSTRHERVPRLRVF